VLAWGVAVAVWYACGVARNFPAVREDKNVPSHTRRFSPSILRCSPQHCAFFNWHRLLASIPVSTFAWVNGF
jgi:hypothetical protein